MTLANQTPEVRDRILQLLAEGKGAHTISKTLRAENIADISQSGVYYQIQKILDDPTQMRLLQIRQRVAMVARSGELIETAWEITDKLKAALEHVKINTDVLEIKDVKLLATLTPLLNTWWRNLAEINGMLKKEQVNLNLTQVNIEHVSTINGKLLAVIQRVLMKLPEKDRNDIMAELEELSKQEAVETTGHVKE